MIRIKKAGYKTPPYFFCGCFYSPLAEKTPPYIYLVTLRL